MEAWLIQSPGDINCCFFNCTKKKISAFWARIAAGAPVPMSAVSGFCFGRASLDTEDVYFAFYRVEYWLTTLPLLPDVSPGSELCNFAHVFLRSFLVFLQTPVPTPIYLIFLFLSVYLLLYLHFVWSHFNFTSLSFFYTPSLFLSLTLSLFSDFSRKTSSETQPAEH